MIEITLYNKSEKSKHDWKQERVGRLIDDLEDGENAKDAVDDFLSDALATQSGMLKMFEKVFGGTDTSQKRKKNKGNKD